MPITATVATVAAGAMAGVPLLNGFLSKEMFFAEAIVAGNASGLRFTLPDRRDARRRLQRRVLRCASFTGCSSVPSRRTCRARRTSPRAACCFRARSSSSRACWSASFRRKR